MNILNIISGNVARAPQTVRFPGREAPAAAYRGSVTMDAAKCLACGICDYVCVSRAIAVAPGAASCEWTYDPGRCTYCGRCVDHCPVAAVTQAGDRGDSYARSGAQRATVTVPYPACPQCGRPAMPYNEAVLGAAFRDVSAELRERIHLCERCRRRATTVALKANFGAATETGRSDDGR